MALNRRDFLKMMGAGAAVFAFGGMGGLSLINKKALVKDVDAQTAGSWTSGTNTSVVAIHASMLPNGRIFYFAGSGYHNSNQNGPFQARLLDLSSGSESTVSMTEDLFCAGQAPLPNGNILVAGGTLRYDVAADNCNGKWHGLRSAYEFNWSSGSLTKVASMRHGRWYPTCVTLPDGRVMVTGGYDEYGDHNRLVEIYNPSTQGWTVQTASSGGSTYTVGASSSGTCSGAGSPSYSAAAPNLFLYPRMHLMPTGNIVVAGMLDDIRLWNRSNGAWSRLGAFTPVYRHYGTSVLLPLNNTTSERGKILVVGGSPTAADPATRACQVLDFNAGSPSIRTVGSLASGRKYLAPVILPDGKVVVFGGAAQGNSNPRYNPEMFDPATETWTSLSNASVPRVYHQVSLLLPDGRVWTAGSTPARNTRELRTEFFRPGYYSATRPTISGAPTVGNYGETITIPTPNAAAITKATLVRCPDTTHHYDANMRLLNLQKVSNTSSSITVQAPLNANLAPPGYYYIHVINGSNIPSVARIIRIPGTGDSGGGGGGGAGGAFYTVASPGDASGSLYTGSSTRYGEEARVSTSVLVGKSLKTWTVWLRRINSPSGTVRAVVRQSSNDAVVATFGETFDASTLTTSYAEKTFTLATAYTIKAGDRILIEYSGPNGIQMDATSTDRIDGSNTRRVRYDGTSYIGGNTVDIVGTMSST